MLWSTGSVAVHGLGSMAAWDLPGPRDQTCVSCTGPGGFFTSEPPWKPLDLCFPNMSVMIPMRMDYKTEQATGTGRLNQDAGRRSLEGEDEVEK